MFNLEALAGELTRIMETAREVANEPQPEDTDNQEGDQ